MKASILAVTAEELANAVPEEEYKRLLSLPRSRNLDGDLLARATEARRWFAMHGDPFVASTKVDIESIHPPVVQVSKECAFHSADLAERLQRGDSHSLVIFAVTAGRNVADQIAKHWSEGRPDEAFFLDRFAAAVAEHLIPWTSVSLCREREPFNETLLPHLSPGCADWDIADQHVLITLLGHPSQIGPITMLSSGALSPQHSVLGVMGVTQQRFTATPKDICRQCNLDPCAFRRAPALSNHPVIS